MNEIEQFRAELLLAAETHPAAAGRVIVTGEGDPHPRIMLIGEAPGAQEEAQGRPFVGKAGKNLDAFLERLGLPREALWISNVVKLRPYKVSAKGTLSNRPPNREELAFFTPWLHREIAMIAPEVIVTLGNTALHAVVDDHAVIGDMHGRPTEVEHPVFGKRIVFPLYHPASVIYNRSLMAVWDQDLDALRSYLG